jgi:hypothetical protein
LHKKSFLVGLSSIGGVFYSISPAHAHCPLCTAATGAAVAVTRFYGLSDAVVGLWIGALAVSMVLWFNKILKKQFVPLQGEMLVIASLLATVIPFYFAGLFSIPGNIIFGVDKLLFGILLGGFLTWIIPVLSRYIKAVNNGKVLFFRQTLILNIGTLVIISVLLFRLV